MVGGIGPWRLLEPLDKLSEDRGFLALLDDGDTAGAWAGMSESAERELASLAALDDEARVDAFLADFGGALTRDVEYRAIWAANLALVIESPEGYVLDNLAWGAIWDVDPADVVAPTMLRYGDGDHHCSPSHGHWYEERIDGSELVVIPGEGHLETIDGHWPEVLAGLLQIWA